MKAVSMEAEEVGEGIMPTAVDVEERGVEGGVSVGTMTVASIEIGSTGGSETEVEEDARGR